ncbi:hypothetical protein FZEAL_8128 [Fusarium zealandicum]|uniref:Uncharacterized protein n=1 Tax=Fusarium zealandicum TaxID=1053134 RepID=A0A8H4XHZ4_9HYPO|nr:hypothetical protein FZEAL_8128 [Fusarium zealandicum]
MSELAESSSVFPHAHRGGTKCIGWVSRYARLCERPIGKGRFQEHEKLLRELNELPIAERADSELLVQAVSQILCHNHVHNDLDKQVTKAQGIFRDAAAEEAAAEEAAAKAAKAAEDQRIQAAIQQVLSDESRYTRQTILARQSQAPVQTPRAPTVRALTARASTTRASTAQTPALPGPSTYITTPHETTARPVTRHQDYAPVQYSQVKTRPQSQTKAREPAAHPRAPRQDFTTVYYEQAVSQPEPQPHVREKAARPSARQQRYAPAYIDPREAQVQPQPQIVKSSVRPVARYQEPTPEYSGRTGRQSRYLSQVQTPDASPSVRYRALTPEYDDLDEVEPQPQARTRKNKQQVKASRLTPPASPDSRRVSIADTEVPVGRYAAPRANVVYNESNSEDSVSEDDSVQDGSDYDEPEQLSDNEMDPQELWFAYNDKWKVLVKEGPTPGARLEDEMPWPVFSGKMVDVNAFNVRAFFEGVCAGFSNKKAFNKMISKETDRWEPSNITEVLGRDPFGGMYRAYFQVIHEVAEKCMDELLV